MRYQIRYLDDHGVDCVAYLTAVNSHAARQAFAVTGFQILTITCQGVK
jgi:hypothetical protein